MKIITKSGKEFQIEWAGVATIDGALRFLLVGTSAQVAFETFSNSRETSVLTQDWDGLLADYVGFSKLKTIDIQQDNNVLIALSKE